MSPAVGDYLTDELRIPRRKVDVLVNGVRAPQDLPPRERSQQRASHGIRDQDIVVGTVSRLFNDHKRVTDLIEAFASIDPTRADLHLIIVGSGPDRPMMEAASAATGAGGKIHFVGRDVPADPYYAIMDVFALVSSREAFGLVAAEAMRAALPVIATRVGGLADIVEDGITGYLVPPRDPPSIRLAMEALIDDKSKRTRMGDAGRRRAEENYSEERYLRDVERLYLSLAEPRNSTRM